MDIRKILTLKMESFRVMQLRIDAFKYSCSFGAQIQHQKIGKTDVLFKIMPQSMTASALILCCLPIFRGMAMIIMKFYLVGPV
jgi:hypothetical protein